MSEQFSAAANFFVSTFVELALLFIVISLFVSIVQYYLPSSRVRSLLGGNRGYFVAISLGAVTPFCSCSTIPMTIGLLKAKADFGPILTFLFISPLLNPYIIALFWVTFGAKVLILYTVFTIFFAILNGAVLQKLGFARYVKIDDKPSCNAKNDDESEVISLNLSVLAKDAVKQFISFLPYIVLGIAVGSVIYGYVPVNFFAKLSTSFGYWLIPFSALLGVFLYVRAATMIPIATTLLAKGMSMGSVMSLAIGGAGASLPEIIMMTRVFRFPVILAFIFSVFFTASVTGLVIEFLH